MKKAWCCFFTGAVVGLGGAGITAWRVGVACKDLAAGYINDKFTGPMSIKHIGLDAKLGGSPLIHMDAYNISGNATDMLTASFANEVLSLPDIAEGVCTYSTFAVFMIVLLLALSNIGTCLYVNDKIEEVYEDDPESGRNSRADEAETEEASTHRYTALGRNS